MFGCSDFKGTKILPAEMKQVLSLNSSKTKNLQRSILCSNN